MPGGLMNGEVDFFKRQIEEFIIKHPAAEGWRIYEEAGGPLGINVLPLFLRQEHPSSLVKQRTIVLTEWWDSKKKKRLGLYDGLIKKGGAGISEEAWCGHLKITWLNSPIDIYRSSAVLSVFPIGQQPTLVATKCTEVMENLFKELRSFHRKLTPRPRNARIIHCANGLDIVLKNVSWNDVFLPSGMAQEIRKEALAFLTRRKNYQSLGIPYKRGFLFAGPPGCGKTLLVKALASEIKKVHCIAVNVERNLEDWQLRKAFLWAESRSPSVLIIEEIDKITRETRVSLSCLLDLLDGLQSRDGVLVLATANKPELLDPALIHRPSRFDRIWHIPLPSLEQRQGLLEKLGAGYFSPEIILRVAKLTEGFTMAYLKEVLVSALLSSMNLNLNERDAALEHSLKTLKSQLKIAAKSTGEIKILNGTGFSPQPGFSAGDVP